MKLKKCAAGKRTANLKYKNILADAVIEALSEFLFIFDGTGQCIKHSRLRSGALNQCRNLQDFISEYDFFDLNENPIPREDLPFLLVLKGQEIKDHQYIVKRASSANYISLSGIPVYGLSSELIMCLFLINEITAMTIEAQEAKRRKAELEAIIDNMSDALIVSDPNGKYISFNKKSREMFVNLGCVTIDECPVEFQYLNQNGDEIPYSSLPVQKALRGEGTQNQRLLIRGNGKEGCFDVNAVPVYDSCGKLSMVITCSRNVTELIQKELLIQKKNHQLEAIISSLQDNIIIFDGNGDIILQNSIQEHHPHAGDSNLWAELDHKKYFDMDGKPLKKAQLCPMRLIQGNMVQHFKYCERTEEKETYFDISGAPVFNPKGEFELGVMFRVDISDLINGQKSLAEVSQRLLSTEVEKNETLESVIEMKDAFLMTISHEFITPVNTIYCALQAIEELYSDQLSEDIKKHLVKIRTNTLRQTRLVNNLLDIAKSLAGQCSINMQNLDIVALTSSILEPVTFYASQKGITVDFQSSVRCKIMPIDEEKFVRMLLNLLSNAIKFTPSEKSVGVFLSFRNHNAIIRVIDQGIGIPKEKLARIFEQFSRIDSSLSRQTEGSGLGLTISKLFTELMGGTISVKSKPGRGSSFKVVIPIIESENCDINFHKTTSKTIVLPMTEMERAVEIEFSGIYLK